MIKKGLKVLVLAGKDKKKEGEVIEIDRSKEQTFKLQSQRDFECRLLLEKKNTNTILSLHINP